MACMETTLDGLTIERDSRTAIYQQLAESLAWRIGTGELPSGMRPPAPP